MRSLLEAMLITQADGSAPDILASAHAPGDNGISFMHYRFDRGIQATGTALQHLIFLTLTSTGRIRTRCENRTLEYVANSGNLALAPADSLIGCYSQGTLSGYMLMVPRSTLSFAVAERSKAGANVVECLRGEDATLVTLGHLLARQVSEGFVDGPLAWHELSDAVVQRLVDAHLSAPPLPARGRLNTKATARVIECIHANIDRSIGVNELADAAQQSWSHFPRLFRRSTGLSPYQYVVKVRLQRAIGLLRTTKLSMTAVAAHAGFADHAHFCRWLRRMYGVSPTQLVARLR